MLEQFEKTWPEGFYNTISSKVKTMATTTKSITIGDSKMYDLNVIYSRTIALFFSDREVDVKDVLAYELAPVPTAMFTEDGMQICKAKSTLKKSLQVEVSRRNAGDEDVTVIDGSALLWTIHWPADGTVADFIDNVKTRLISYLSESDVYLIFDGYYDYSIKSVTRDVWETVVNRKHHLLLSTKLPAQKVVLSSIENKKQLNLLLFKELTEYRLFYLQGTNKHKLVVTGEDSFPIEIRMEERRSRN
ncbi:ATP-dependent 6-phosphofructokinase [Dissostichus eleginoides]|uniref:ATP-dependent 6-phosphofructokinase n=1 Tax=Dissostichus eleginoides TaxID=100907 RepID=A0AAD9CIF3_DISEL|nr:ATP-dependent 6-phosphofructokinase [Dissostichus eleginoides]